MAIRTNGSTTVTREPRRAVGGGPGVGVPVAPSGVPARRRWGRVAAGTVLVLVGAWASASLYTSAGDRVEVVVVARDLDRFDEIDRNDLRSARVAADPGVDSVAAAEIDALVGRVAATELSEGQLLSEDQLVDPDERLVGAGDAVVGARLGPGAAPRRGLAGGTRVMVVVRPAATGGEDAPMEVEGWLRDIGSPDTVTGHREASLVVPTASAAEVAAAASDQRIAVVALEGIGGGG